MGASWTTGGGAVYVFVRSDSSSNWTLNPKITTDNGDADDEFGISVNGSGNILAVGAFLEDSAAIGINNGDQNDNSARQAGAVYLY